MAITLVKEKESYTSSSGSFPYFCREDAGNINSVSAVTAATTQCVTDWGVTSTDYRWQRISNNTGRVECIYQPTKLARLTPSAVGQVRKGFNFQMEPIDLTFTLQRISKQPSTAPDFGGAINVPSGHDWNDAAGVHLPAPAEVFYFDKTVAAGTITDAYIFQIAQMVGTANNALYKTHFAAGSLCLVRASGQAVTDSAEQLYFGFGWRLGVSGYSIGSFSVTWEGFDYPWAWSSRELEGATGEKILSTKPRAVYVDRIMRRTDFATLPI